MLEDPLGLVAQADHDHQGSGDAGGGDDDVHHHRDDRLTGGESGGGDGRRRGDAHGDVLGLAAPRAVPTPSDLPGVNDPRSRSSISGAGAASSCFGRPRKRRTAATSKTTPNTSCSVPASFGRSGLRQVDGVGHEDQDAEDQGDADDEADQIGRSGGHRFLAEQEEDFGDDRDRARWSPRWPTGASAPEEPRHRYRLLSEGGPLALVSCGSPGAWTACMVPPSHSRPGDQPGAGLPGMARFDVPGPALRPPPTGGLSPARRRPVAPCPFRRRLRTLGDAAEWAARGPPAKERQMFAVNGADQTVRDARCRPSGKMLLIGCDR